MEVGTQSSHNAKMRLDGDGDEMSIGFGADRFNQVSDAASLRAVAELTAAGGFLGAIALEEGTRSYRIHHEPPERVGLRLGDCVRQGGDCGG